MINIAKGSTPKSLSDYQSHPNAVYDGQNFTPVKDEIRKALVNEQKGICAYCMRRIRPDSKHMKVEHWQSQDSYPTEQLNYRNMLGVCLGHEGSPQKDQTCDTRKGELELKYNPANHLHNVNSKIYYKSEDGRINSSDEEFSQQIGGETNSVLNLNHPIIKRNRLEVLKGLQATLSKKPGQRTKAELMRLLKAQESKTEYSEYVGVLFYYLERYYSSAK